MQLKESAIIILKQIESTIDQLKPEEYSAPLDLLSGNSVGKHVRHVLEFFHLLLTSIDKEKINYDLRNHDETIETDKNISLNKINQLILSLNELKKDKAIQLEVAYSIDQSLPTSVQTSIERELAYNIEHAIHHMAIIKIAIITLFPHVSLPKDFGVAYSTIRYQKEER